MPGEVSFARALAELTYIRATSRLGKPQQAVELAQTFLQQQGAYSLALSLRPLLAMCGTFYDQQDLDELHATGLTFRQLAKQAGRPLSVAWTSWILGYICYQRNELSSAEQYYSEVVQHPYEAHTRTLIDSWTGLCLTLHARGCRTEAVREAEALRLFLLNGGQIELAQIADALAVYLELLGGQAVRINHAYSQDLERQLGQDLVIAPVLIWALGCIRSGEREQQAAVAARLDEFRSLLAHDHIPRRLLEIELLQALLHDAQRERKAALAAVRRAIALAAGGGAVRAFVDCGQELIPYLHELAGMAVKPAFVARILAAYAPQAHTTPQAPPPATPTAQGNTAQGNSAQGNSALGPDALTNRELDVLVLLERRLSNKEIAAALVISPLTVKRHTRTIYSKLDVNSRRAAVARARTLGLIAPA
jgi:LuxR family maltose regulon positive regulatory protein